MWILIVALLAAGVGAAITFFLIRTDYLTGRAIHALRDGVLILDNDQNIVSMNKQFAQYLQADASDYIGQPYSTLLQQMTVKETTAPDSSNPRTEITVNNHVLEATDTAISDPLGNQSGRVIVYHNVTGRSRVESRLGDRLEKLVALRRIYSEISEKLEVNTVLMFALDGAIRLSGADAGYIAMKNAAGRYEAGQVLGPVDQQKVNKVLNSGKGIVNRVIANERAELIPDVHKDPDYLESVERTEAIIIVPLFTVEDEMMGLLTLVSYRTSRFTEDVFELSQILSNRISAGIINAQLYEQVESQLEELKTSNAQIVELEKLKTEMIRIAAHDLGTPLSIIMMRVQFMERTDVLSEKLQNSLNEIMQAARSMERLRNNILSLEKIEQMAVGSADRTNIVDLYEKTALAMDSLMPLAFRKKIQLQMDAEETTRYIVYGEVDQLHEAISNLISNAIKYTGEEGQVNVSLKLETNAVVLRVKDNGFGIPESEQEELFKPFRRIKTEETAGIEGTGLGLHLVKSIVERHGGTIIFESEYGKGSTFGFSMPAATEKPEDSNS